MPYFQVVTFGCKVNQYESAWMSEVLADAGFTSRPPQAAPDLILVNTCTVTARADQQARQTMRRLARQYPRAEFWVTGCYAQRSPETLALLPGVARVFGNREKAGLAEMVHSRGEHPGPQVQVAGFAALEPFQACQVRRFPGHTRAWLKIQDGCSHACSYCIVPAVRGPGRSLPWAAVQSSLETLAASGFEEVVLTGIDLGQYGRDFGAGENLARLLTRLSRHDWPFRWRLSSLEPQEISHELLHTLATLPHLCPHFHLPMQSGSGAVLRDMGRPYQPGDFRDLVMELHRLFPKPPWDWTSWWAIPGRPPSTSRPPGPWWSPCRWPTCTSSPFPPGPAPRPAVYPPSRARKWYGTLRLCENLASTRRRHFTRLRSARWARCWWRVRLRGRPGWLNGLAANYARVILPGPAAWRNRRCQVRFQEVKEERLWVK